MRVSWVGLFSSPCGYGVGARAHCEALIKGGLELELVDFNQDPLRPERKKIFNEFMEGYYPTHSSPKPTGDVVIWNIIPPMFEPNPGQRNIGAIYWELTSIPTVQGMGADCSWADRLNEMDECWTFSRMAEEALRRSGVTKRIRVMSVPVDGDHFCPSFPPMNLPELDGKFVFLASSQWTPRKDFTSLLRAYLSEFTPVDKVALVIKSYRSSDSESETSAILKDISTIRTAVDGRRKLSDFPPVYLNSDIIPYTSLPGLYTAADCLVVTSRGEGFGLPIIESMLCGRPAISHTFSSMGDYLTDDNSFIAGHRVEPVFGMVGTPWYQPHMGWGSVDIFDLKSKMRYAYSNPNVVKDRGVQARLSALSMCDSDLISSKMISAIAATPESKKLQHVLH